MFSFLTILSVISLASAAVLQLPQPIAQAVPAPSSDPLTQLVYSNGSLSLASPATAITVSELNTTSSGGIADNAPVVKYKCDGGKWDRDLNPKSCLSAWASIPRAPGPVLTFASRDADRRYGVGLPKRYLSSDGTCAIEPLLLPGRSFAKAKLADLALASSVVIDGCVGGKSSTGGAVWDFGDGGLALTVSRFRPEVRCYGSIPSDNRILTACESLADRMRTSSTTETFGQVGTDPDTVLPKQWTSDDGLCTMLVSTRTPNQEDTSVWYKFWDAAVAINAMCIRKGQSGIWDDLGIKGHLEIQVFGGAFGENVTVA